MLDRKTRIDEPPRILWWRKGQEVQNFGDFLSDFLWDSLAEEVRIEADVYRVIGSAIDDWIISDDLKSIGKWDGGRIAFWCCGMRDDKALSTDSLTRSVFCGVRGPLTRDRLRLPSSIPMGDPALLLPLLYTPKVSEKTRGRIVCSPHFLDESCDRELLETTGAGVVLRPSIASSRDAVLTSLDDLASAEFVLAGSLHAAIVACAYGVPFCYFDRGQVDIPFKWRDFSASINVGTFFVDNAAEGRKIYETAIRPRLSKPLLFPILAAAPFRVRPKPFLKAAIHDAALLKANNQIRQDAFSAFINLANKDIAAVGTEAHRITIADLTARLDEARVAREIALGALDQERDASREAIRIAEARSTERDAAQAALSEAEARAAERDAAQAALSEAEARAAERERDEARARLANAQNRASEFEATAWRTWQAEVGRCRQERDFLARYLLRTYQRPWRPFRHRALSGSLLALSGLVAPVNKRMSARFANSARKRSADRFEAFLREPLLSPEAKARRQEGKLNILYFSPFPSHPANHGNQATIQQFGRRFQALGHKVHFALLESPMYDADAERGMREAWNSLAILPNTKPLWANGSDIPFDGWYEEGLGERVEFLCAVYDIDVVFCSYVFQSKLLESVAPHILKVIDTHDKMGDRYEMLRRNGQPLEFFSCSPREEGDYLRRADVVVARREEEALYFNSVTGRETAIVIPHVEDPRFVDKTFKQLANVGVVASANHINLAVTLDFLQTLARQCGAAPPFTVHIAGQVRDMVKYLDQESAKAFSAPWVTTHGFVPDIGDFYRRMDVIVSPVTMGTGINVKTVQAMAYGMPLVTTKCGAKGIATNEPMHHFPDLSSLVAGLLTLADRPQELDRLAAVSRQHYDHFYEAASRNIRLLFDNKKLNGSS